MLPPDFIKRVREALVPHMSTVAKRRGYLMEALYTADRRLYQTISLEGDAREFTLACIGELLEHGCLPDHQHRLGLLLNAVREDCGDADARRIDPLIDLLAPECADDPPPASTASIVTPSLASAPVPPAQAVIDIHTPLVARRPSVFLSYSRKDADSAEKVRLALTQGGHVCWIDTESIKGGEVWLRAIAEGINNSYAVVAITSQNALGSSWCRDEILWARNLAKPIIPVLLENCTRDPGFLLLISYNPIHLYQSESAGLSRLLASIGAPPVVAPTPTVSLAEDKALRQRAQELEYLSRLDLENWLQTIHKVEEYTPLAGTIHQIRAVEVSTHIETRYQRMRQALLGKESPTAARETIDAQRPVSDIVTGFKELKRVVLLGEPGEGKSTTLWKIAQDYYEAAQKSAKAPIPLLIRLGKWNDSDQPLPDFIRAELGGLGTFLDDLLMEKRAVLLLDGLNEIQLSQRQAGKDEQVQRFLEKHPDLPSIVSCRVRDYTRDLGFHRIQITPLDPPRILDFATRYLGESSGQAMFWKICGDGVKEVWQKWESAGVSFDLFFTAPDVPQENPDVYHSTSGTDDDLWRAKVRAPGTLLTLARNAYMLTMMAGLYRANGRLPDNRAELFTDFVDRLIDREIGDRARPKNPRMLARERDLRAALPKLAAQMQFRRTWAVNTDENEAGDADEEISSVATSLATETVKADLLDDELLYLAGSASLLDVGEVVRFSHQLLQEYFTAWYLYGEIRAGRLDAKTLWPPEHWWQPSGWEEAAILLVGMYPEMIDWVAAANPEVAAQCIVRSGAVIPREKLDTLRDAWLPCLTDLARDPSPHARAAVGRALAIADLDDRPGVGLLANGFPDIDWCIVPDDGKWKYQDKQHHPLPAYWIAKYLITYRQFQAFIDAGDGYGKAIWWADLHQNAQEQREAEPFEQSFKFWNHPRESVSWYQAMAFCAWLTDKLRNGLIPLPAGLNAPAADVTIRLPTEWEWEKATRGVQGWEYPWGNRYEVGCANINESGLDRGTYLRQTSPVGIYPQGASPYEALDMSGNVWEWMLTEYRSGKANVGSNERRVLRGGSWNVDQRHVRAAVRRSSRPDLDHNNIGVRVVVRPPSR